MAVQPFLFVRLTLELAQADHEQFFYSVLDGSSECLKLGHTYKKVRT